MTPAYTTALRSVMALPATAKLELFKHVVENDDLGGIDTLELEIALDAAVNQSRELDREEDQRMHGQEVGTLTSGMML